MKHLIKKFGIRIAAADIDGVPIRMRRFE